MAAWMASLRVAVLISVRILIAAQRGSYMDSWMGVTGNSPICRYCGQPNPRLV